MAFDQATYMRDNQEPDTKGIVIIETGEPGVRVTENRDGDWCKPFWMPVSELASIDTETVGKLSSDQFLGVCQQAGVTPTSGGAEA